jgi:hypothetical protein
MAAILLLYLTQLCSENIFQRNIVPFVAGLLGGIAFLAKAYAFPFFLVHFPLTLALRWWMLHRRPEFSRQVHFTRLVSSIAVGLIGFLIVAGPWIAVLSQSYHRLTFSTAGNFNHNEVESAPIEVKYRPVLFVPPDPYIIEGEIIDRRTVTSWSPLDSRKRLGQQWNIIKKNIPDIIVALGGFDHVWLVPVCLAMALSMGVRCSARQAIWRLTLLSATLMVYCSGFTVIYFEPRLITVALRFPGIVLCTLVALELQRRLKNSPLSFGRVVGFAAPGFVLIAITFTAMIDIVAPFKTRTSGESASELAAMMRHAGLRGPIASSDRGFGAYVAFFLDTKLITVPHNEPMNSFRNRCQIVRSVLIIDELTNGRSDYRAIQLPLINMVQQPGWTKRIQIWNSHIQCAVYERIAD